MKLVDLVNFFKSPHDRDIIAHRTAPPGPRGYTLELPQPPDPERFVFLALGDSGDSAAVGAQQSPQDAVAACLAEDAALPESQGDARLVVHTGDVVYMTGERRMYDRNFRRPYAPFLTAGSTVDHLVFRLPFLPVPGNHDYYDYSGIVSWLTRTPILGAGVAAVARELFGFHLPQGGSDMGAAYMHAFVAGSAAERDAPYELGHRTRIPNRYYRFRVGNADFFALDSNTLEAPPPNGHLDAEREDAARHVRALERRARALSRQIERDERAVEKWLQSERERAAEDVERLAELRVSGLMVGSALDNLATALRNLEPATPACGPPADEAAHLAQRWRDATAEVVPGGSLRANIDALENLDGAADRCCELLDRLEVCFTELPAGSGREALEAARDAVLRATARWRDYECGSPPADLCERLRRLSARALDVHRHLALERRRVDRRPEDHDAAQLEWLREGLEQSLRDNPDGWRIVYLHQPLYTTIGNHSENHDVVGVRENLLPLLRDRVHLVLAGHAHAFEWFRSDTLPTTGLVVTGGGGQPWLWRSILDPRQIRRFRSLYQSLRDGGAMECALAGFGPPAADGERGGLYHYLRVEVTPDRILVTPVGVRRIDNGYRRETPMPVYHVPELPSELPVGKPLWQRRFLSGIEIRRGEPPQPLWANEL